MSKKLAMDQLVGKRIVSADKWEDAHKSWALRTDAGNYTLQIEDDGYGGNDSHAWLSGVASLDTITGKTIARVEEESNGYGAEIKLHTEDGAVCVLKITHEQNGYYGFCYELVPKTEGNA
jgi:hypothetical protein